jgi:ribosome modulation factor
VRAPRRSPIAEKSKASAVPVEIGPLLLLLLLFAAGVQHNAHSLRTPKHEGLYRYGLWTEVWPQLLLLFNTTRKIRVKQRGYHNGRSGVADTACYYRRPLCSAQRNHWPLMKVKSLLLRYS